MIKARFFFCVNVTRCAHHLYVDKSPSLVRSLRLPFDRRILRVSMSDSEIPRCDFLVMTTRAGYRQTMRVRTDDASILNRRVLAVDRPTTTQLGQRDLPVDEFTRFGKRNSIRLRLPMDVWSRH